MDATNAQGWINPDDNELEPSYIASIGFLVEETSETISISSSVSDSFNVLGMTTIPKGWIKKRRYIK
jgi:hypothetical protein